jgi:hypothetical protein
MPAAQAKSAIYQVVFKQKGFTNRHSPKAMQTGRDYSRNSEGGVSLGIVVNRCQVFDIRTVF